MFSLLFISTVVINQTKLDSNMDLEMETGNCLVFSNLNGKRTGWLLPITAGTIHSSHPFLYSLTKLLNITHA